MKILLVSQDRNDLLYWKSAPNAKVKHSLLILSFYFIACHFTGEIQIMKITQEKSKSDIQEI